MRPISLQMDNAKFLQTSSERIVVKTQNFLAWIAITAVTPFIILFLWGQRSVLLQWLNKIEFTPLVCILTLILIILMIVLVGLLKKNSIIIDSLNRKIKIGQGIITQQIPFAKVSYIRIVEGAFYHHQIKGVYILVILKSEAIIPIGSVSSSYGNTVAATVAKLLGNALGVEIRDETPLERIASTSSKADQPIVSLLPPVKLWTPATIGLTSFFLGFPGGIVLSSINWKRMGLITKAFLHLIGLSILEFILIIQIVFVMEPHIELAIGLGLFVNLGISLYLQHQNKKDLNTFQTYEQNVQNANGLGGYLIGLSMLALFVMSIFFIMHVEIPSYIPPMLEQDTIVLEQDNIVKLGECTQPIFDGGDGLETTGCGVLEVEVIGVGTTNGTTEAHNWQFSAHQGERIRFLFLPIDDRECPTLKLIFIDTQGEMIRSNYVARGKYCLNQYKSYYFDPATDGTYILRIITPEYPGTYWLKIEELK